MSEVFDLGEEGLSEEEKRRVEELSEKIWRAVDALLKVSFLGARIKYKVRNFFELGLDEKEVLIIARRVLKQLEDACGVSKKPGR